MKKTILATSLALYFSSTAYADIFISEYVEGSSNNKAIELYNPTADEIDLSAYNLQVFANGKTTVTSNIQLSGIIKPGETFVITNSAAINELKQKADITSGSATWNGNDALVLEKAGMVLDSFGRVGEDPGKAWTSGSISTVDVTLRRRAVMYDTQSSDEFNPAAEWLAFANNDFSDIGRFSVEEQPTDPVIPTDPVTPPDPEEPTPVLTCGAAFTPIHTIQGAGAASPLQGQTIVTEGVVTQLLGGLRGFMLQAVEYDQDALTSEGIFVFYNNQALKVDVGQKIRLKAAVTERFNNTQLQNITEIAFCGEALLPTAVQISLPVVSEDYLERYEGMLVSFKQELTVNGNLGLGRFGELVLADGRRFSPTQLVSPGEPAKALAAKQALNKILLDDGSSQQNPAVVPYPAPSLSAFNTVRAGDTVIGLTGTLLYSFNEYRINPSEPVNFIATNPRTTAPELTTEGNLKIASFNVLNYFNGDGQGGGFPTARGASSLQEFERQRAKILAALTALDVSVIGLMELENDGFAENSAIADLVAGMRATSGYMDWQFISVNTPQIGTDEITVGLIYRSDLVSPSGAAKILTSDNSALDSSGSPLFDASRNRPTLAQRFKLKENSTEFAVLVNHLKSKGSACAGDPDLGDGQGNCNITRTRAAEAIATFATAHFDEIPTVILGDLNAYAKEDPLTKFANLGYKSAFDVLGKLNPYGYVFGNLAGQLDHVLLNSSAQEIAVDVAEWHINADEPLAFDYNLEFKSIQQQIDYYSSDAYRSSDHDPIVVALKLGSEEVPPEVTIPELFVHFFNRGFSFFGIRFVGLSWTADQQSIKLYRDSKLIKQGGNNAFVIDIFATRKNNVAYQVCSEIDQLCSESVKVSFR